VKLTATRMQCRITTEDPQNNFIPDYGRITAYRGATGMGIRLDGGTAYSGAVITRYYDSLLEKVTAWAPTPEAAIARMDRALREFRIRGVSTNIAFVENLLKHPTFLNTSTTTKFIDRRPSCSTFARAATGRQNPDLYRRHHGQRASRNPGPAGPPAGLKPRGPPAAGTAPPDGHPAPAWNPRGQGVADWMKAQKRVLITDTTMRDGHQSLLATRMRSIDMIKVAPAYAATCRLFSVECWGGATFDVAYRFLQECPWQRLRDLRAAMPNIMTQMLLRGVERRGLHQLSRQCGAVLRQAGGRDRRRRVPRVRQPQLGREHARGDGCGARDRQASARARSATPAISSTRTGPKYDLKYYVAMAKELEAAGAHVLGLKDMAGLLKPDAARVLFKALKEEVGLPIHFHTHDTSGLPAARCWPPSRPASTRWMRRWTRCRATPRSPASARSSRRCAHRPATPASTSARSARSRLLGGRARPIRGLRSGCRPRPPRSICTRCRAGSSPTSRRRRARWGWRSAGTRSPDAYADVNQMFGDIVKVTPSSKVVGDMALMMVSQGLSRAGGRGPRQSMSPSPIRRRHDARRSGPAAGRVSARASRRRC
jgi:pyruvate carboxylase